MSRVIVKRISEKKRKNKQASVRSMFPQVRWKKKKKRKEETKVNDNGRNEEWTMVIFCRVYNGIATMGEKWGSRVAATGFLLTINQPLPTIASFDKRRASRGERPY